SLDFLDGFVGAFSLVLSFSSSPSFLSSFLSLSLSPFFFLLDDFAGNGASEVSRIRITALSSKRTSISWFFSFCVNSFGTGGRYFPVVLPLDVVDELERVVL